MYKVGFEHLQERYRRVLKELLDVLLEAFGEKLFSLVVFGSVARSEADEQSDIDILIVADGLPRGRLARQDIFLQLEERLDERIGSEHPYLSPILKTPEEARELAPIYLDMVEDAVILYDRDRFFRQVLDRLRKRLMELGAERRRIGRMRYWVLKRDYRFGEVIKIG